MSEIRKCDLVLVVDGCCDGWRSEYQGDIFTVDKIGSHHGSGRCRFCKQPRGKDWSLAWKHLDAAYPVEWLRKINPPVIEEREMHEAAA